MTATARAGRPKPHDDDEQHHAAKRKSPKHAQRPPRAPATEWWALLALIEEERASGLSIVRGRELRVWEACIRNVNAKTGRCDDKDGRPVSYQALAADAGVSIPTFYRSLARLRDAPSAMPLHQGRGVRTNLTVKRKPRDESAAAPPRPRRPDCPPRAAPLGLLHLEHLNPDYKACGHPTRRACDAEHRKAEHKARRAGQPPPPHCVHHHGGMVIWPAVRTAAAARAILGDAADAGAEVYEVTRSGKGRAVDNPGGRPLRRTVDNPHPDPRYLSTDASALSAAARNETFPPPPESVGGTPEARERDERVTRARAPSGPCASATEREPHGVAPSKALRSEQAADAARAGGDARRGTEGGRAETGPTSAREHPELYELGTVLARWRGTKTARFPSGLPMMPFMFETLARRRADGATLEELELVVDGVAGGTGEDEHARQAAEKPAAAAYGDLERVHRYAAAGRRVRRDRDQALAMAWRAARQREERAAATAREREEVAADVARVGAELREAMRSEERKPGGSVTRAELERRRAEQLERLAAEAARDLASEATGELVEMQIVYVDAAKKLVANAAAAGDDTRRDAPPRLETRPPQKLPTARLRAASESRGTAEEIGRVVAELSDARRIDAGAASRAEPRSMAEQLALLAQMSEPVGGAA